MRDNEGYEIRHNGVPRTFRDNRQSAFEAARYAKSRSKMFLRCARKIEEGSVELARRKGYAAVCCGHTHVAKARLKEIHALAT